ncbi:hypothetical protein OMCYN_01742 [cyanobiont of Ornithocercus magnificus]|nr:hypothetical protein OMCYN_01742 [cyanobiont of Ornithocercus magnificus]
MKVNRHGKAAALSVEQLEALLTANSAFVKGTN